MAPKESRVLLPSASVASGQGWVGGVPSPLCCRALHLEMAWTSEGSAERVLEDIAEDPSLHGGGCGHRTLPVLPLQAVQLERTVQSAMFLR